MKVALALTVALGLALAGPAGALESGAPSLWDPAHRPEKPDLGGLRQLRFVTEDDYPPFNFALADGQLAGFNVDLARAICEELELTCTIQRRRWDLLIPALGDDSADAIIAALAMNDENRARVDFTGPYFIMPGRFVTRANSRARPRDAGGFGLPTCRRGRRLEFTRPISRPFSPRRGSRRSRPPRWRGSRSRTGASTRCSATRCRCRSGSTGRRRRVAAPFPTPPMWTPSSSATASA